MKRLILFIFMLAVAAGGLLFSQTRRGSWPEKITVSGVLGIARGQIAIQSDGKSHYLMGLDRYIGFIDGLKEGASVEVEGYAMQTGTRNSRNAENNEVYMRVTSLTMDGKTYDLDDGLLDFSGFGRILRFDWNDLPWFNGENAPRMNNRMMPPQFPSFPAPPFRQQPQTPRRR